MTGLHLAEFEDLVSDVRLLYQAAESARLNRPDRQRAIGGGDHPDLSEGNQILLTVSGLGLYPRQDVLGYFFGISQTTVSHYLSDVLPILEQAGRERMRMPDPGPKRRRPLSELLPDMPDIRLVIDSFEQKVQRPTDPTRQDDWYSRKKKTHSLKRQVAVDEATGESVDIPERVPGPQADLKRLEQSTLLDKLPAGVGGRGECGYQGIAKLHPKGYRPPRNHAAKTVRQRIAPTPPPSLAAALSSKTRMVGYVVIRA